MRLTLVLIITAAVWQLAKRFDRYWNGTQKLREEAFRRALDAKRELAQQRWRHAQHAQAHERARRSA